ncbi:hypothetical protein [Xanthomonas oryzae]|uniref:Uncharacterized protein n=1 Tax=Xanthomonas oryzae pv. leersiae TaxID=3112258 RepID=A0AAJ6GUY4_9XANT|nr:hypothetical protein [Xanthomonas oryzae]WIX08422.1 hypothetical protein QN060_11050 [Xanthomonas oryzae pv. oryzae]
MSDLVEIPGAKLFELYAARDYSRDVNDTTMVAIYEHAIEQRIQLIGNTPAVAA